MQGDAREGCGIGQNTNPGAERGAGNHSSPWQRTPSAGHLLTLPEIPLLTVSVWVTL